MSKNFKIVVGLLLAGVIGIASGNFFLLQRNAQLILDSDPRNEGISIFAHYGYFVVPSVLVIDLRKVSGINSPADVTRVLLQFSQTQKANSYSQVKLAHRGTSKFILKGDYFKTLGVEFGQQNPVYTMRTLPENVYKMDGTAAFGTWTGGMLGVLGKQMEEFGEFHRQWYISDSVK